MALVILAQDSHLVHLLDLKAINKCHPPLRDLSHSLTSPIFPRMASPLHSVVYRRQAPSRTWALAALHSMLPLSRKANLRVEQHLHLVLAHNKVTMANLRVSHHTVSRAARLSIRRR